jgi:hypothetical protein
MSNLRDSLSRCIDIPPGKQWRYATRFGSSLPGRTRTRQALQQIKVALTRVGMVANDDRILCRRHVLRRRKIGQRVRGMEQPGDRFGVSTAHLASPRADNEPSRLQAISPFRSAVLLGPNRRYFPVVGDGDHLCGYLIPVNREHGISRVRRARF